MAMDLYKGWPLDGALNDNIKPKDGEDIVAGMFVKKDALGELVKADDTSGEQVFFALESQADYAVVGAQKMAVVTHNAIMLTDQYDGGQTYNFGDPVYVDSGDPGKLTSVAGNNIVAKADGFITRDGIDFLKIHIGD